jgi:hypothetical protein
MLFRYITDSNLGVFFCSPKCFLAIITRYFISIYAIYVRAQRIMLNYDHSKYLLK